MGTIESNSPWNSQTGAWIISSPAQRTRIEKELKGNRTRHNVGKQLCYVLPNPKVSFEVKQNYRHMQSWRARGVNVSQSMNCIMRFLMCYMLC